jgi:hypothetical protein
VKPVIARRNTEHGSGLGKERWVVERTFAWLHDLRRLRIRYERDPGLHMAFMLLGCAAWSASASSQTPESILVFSVVLKLRRPYWSGIEPRRL